MCFSAQASFAASAVLSTAGAIAIIKTPKSSQIMFASIPLLFGIQQAIEGFLWISLRDGTNEWMQNALAYGFLFFAQVLWTTWVPLSFLFMEEVPKRRKILHWLSVAGIFISLILGSRLLFFGIHVSAREHHVHYDIYSPTLLVVFNSIFYVTAVIAPCFVSSKKGTGILGLLLSVSLACTVLFYQAYVVSVWCFFAAILSAIVFYVIYKLKKEQQKI